MEKCNDIKNIKKKVISGLVWKFMERGGVQVIQFIVSMILARILLPQEYGTVALITVFISIANVFIEVGLTTALIQKKNVDDVECSSVFYFNLLISIFLYFILYFLSEGIAKFYYQPILSPIFKIQSLTLIIGVFSGIQNVILTRKMEFKKSFYRNLSGVFAYAIVGVVLACSGFGVWSLVFAQLSSSLIGAIVLWITVKWRPKKVFSFDKIRSLFQFGSKMLYSGLLFSIFNNVYSVVIGRLYDGAMLGYYNRAQNIPTMIVNNINETIAGVMFPTLASYQNDKTQLKNILRRSMVTSCFIIFPIMFGLATVAEPLTIILFTEKWIHSVPFMKIICIAFAFQPINTANLQAISAIGRSDIYLKLEIKKKIVIIIVLLITIPYGVYVMIIGSAITSIISVIINAWPNRKLLNYTLKEQLIDILPSLTLSIVMSLIVSLIGLIQLNIWISLILQVSIGIIIYLLGAYMLNLECFSYLLSILKKNNKYNKYKF